jgi:hypothetical protein
MGEGAWLSAVVADYEAEARNGRTLDDVFGLILTHGQRSWWQLQDIELRDAALRELAAECYPTECPAVAAREIAKRLLEYETTRWKSDKNEPLSFAEQLKAPRKQLFRALKSGAKSPGSRRLQDILAP